MEALEEVEVSISWLVVITNNISNLLKPFNFIVYHLNELINGGIGTWIFFQNIV